MLDNITKKYSNLSCLWNFIVCEADLEILMWSVRPFVVMLTDEQMTK